MNCIKCNREIISNGVYDPEGEFVRDEVSQNEAFVSSGKNAKHVYTCVNRACVNFDKYLDERGDQFNLFN